MLYTYPITRSINFSSLIIKSHNITSYSLFSILTSYSSLYSLYLSNLFLQQSRYSLVTFLIRFYIFLIIYSYYNLITSTIALLWPYIIPLQNSIMKSFASSLGIYIVSLSLYFLQSRSISCISLIYYSYELTSALYIPNNYRQLYLIFPSLFSLNIVSNGFLLPIVLPFCLAYPLLRYLSL